jgi:DNA-binding CsgD family transcriptional regulator
MQGSNTPTLALADLKAPALDLPTVMEILEELDVGVIVCTEDAQVLLANDTARDELQRGEPLALDADGHAVPRGGSPSGHLRWRNALRAAVHGSRRLVPLGDDPGAPMVAMVPLTRGLRPMALVLLGRRRLAPALSVEMLARQRDLTPAEQTVLGALLDGHRVNAVAQGRQVKVSTLRTQVACLRSKLNVQRAEDFVRLASALPPIHGVLRSPPLAAIVAAARTAGRPADLPLPDRRPFEPACPATC